MKQKALVIERIYEAPIRKVWEAITTKEQMEQWYFEITDFKAEVGFEFQFYGEKDGKRYLHNCAVVEADPITKISYTWSYEGYVGKSLVTFELFREAEQRTRLKLTHSDLDTFPKEEADFSQENFTAGWNSLLGESLRDYVEVGSIEKSIRIRASLRDVWEVLLHPDGQWGLAFGGGTITETDWKEGSSIIWKDTDGNVGANGVVEVHQQQAYMQLHYYDTIAPTPDDVLGDYYEKFRLVQDGDVCILSIESGVLSKSYLPSHGEMWDQALEMIKKIAEG